MNDADAVADYAKQQSDIETCIALLHQYKKTHSSSMAISLAAGVILLVAGIAALLSLYWYLALVLLIVLGLVETYYALRIGFDIRLLQQLSACKRDHETAMKRLDDSLLTLSLIAPATSGRQLQQRLLACLRMFKIQNGIVLAQWGMLLIAPGIYFLINGS